MGLHRFYLRSMWGFIFIPVFLAIIYVELDTSATSARTCRARTQRSNARIFDTRPRQMPAAAPRQRRAMTERLQSRAAEAKAKAEAAVETKRARPLAKLFALARDPAGARCCWSMPRCCRASCGGRRAREAAHRDAANAPPSSRCLTCRRSGPHEDPTHAAAYARSPTCMNGSTSRIGEFVAYWAVISVFVYYYEVIARLRFQLAHQLGAREHVPDVRHAVHAVRRLCVP